MLTTDKESTVVGSWTSTHLLYNSDVIFNGWKSIELANISLLHLVLERLTDAALALYMSYAASI